MKDGIVFHPKSQYAAVCADVKLINPPAHYQIIHIRLHLPFFFFIFSKFKGFNPFDWRYRLASISLREGIYGFFPSFLNHEVHNFLIIGLITLNNSGVAAADAVEPQLR